MTVLEIEGRRIEVGDAFKSLSPEQQQAAVEEIARDLNLSNEPGGVTEFLGQAARSLGGVADTFVTGARNDIRRFRGQDIIPHGGEGSITDALVDARIASPNEPVNVAGQAGRAAGDALAAFAPVVKTAQAAKSLSGVAGGIADDAYRALATRRGMGAEVMAGAASGAGQLAEDAGYGEAVQSLAGLAAPLSVPAAGAALRGTGRVVDAATDLLPGVSYAKGVARDVRKALVPMTDAGARDVARQRLAELAGGEDRAAELGQRINPSDEFGRTGAEQTGDPNLLGLQNAATKEYPVVRERLEDRRALTADSITASVRALGGDVGDARNFFDRRLKSFQQEMETRANRVIQNADDQIDALSPQRSEASNSVAVAQRLKLSLDDALAEEASLWAAVPTDSTVATQNAKRIAQSIVDATPRAQQRDIPNVVRQLLTDEGGFGDGETVAEMHGLYSELRRQARSAMAGSDQNKNSARIANAIADGILQDLGTLDPTSQVGKAVNEARAFSKALHQTFDRGAVGRILKRTLDGDTTIAPETALDRTVGRGGTAALADDQSLRTAAAQAGQEVSDYLRGRFSEAIVDPSGQFSPKAARRWLRSNAEILSRYPGFKDEAIKALENRASAQAFAVRSEARAALASKGSVAEFNSGKPGTAVQAILAANDPIQAARSITATARKDSTGKALAGVKGALSGYLAEDPKRISAFWDDRKIKGALRQVYSPDELDRLIEIGKVHDRMSARVRDVGEVISTPANKLVEMVVRVAAAKGAARVHGSSDAGVSLQAASMGSGRAADLLRNLTNDKARRLLVDAVEDPKLMRALLMDASAPTMPDWARSRLAPYLTGGLAATE